MRVHREAYAVRLGEGGGMQFRTVTKKLLIDDNKGCNTVAE